MKSKQKLTVTLSMLWIGAMALASTPDWLRAARNFVTKSTTGQAPTTTATNNTNSGANRLVP